MRGGVRPMTRPIEAIVLGALLAIFPAASPLAANLDYVDGDYSSAEVVVDSRPASACATSSLPGARCLPAEDFLGPHRRMANISGMLWVLGSAGLTGDEHVLVVGDAGQDKEFVAGLLYLAGQRRVSLQTRPLAELQQAVDGPPPGRARAMTRLAVFQAPMRDDSIVLRNELRKLMQTAQTPVLLDGRSEAEFWGERIRAQRGGHLPGAQHFPARALAGGDADTSAALQAFSAARPVVYGHDAYEGIVYLSRLLDAGVDAHLYLEGWAGWASDGALPADSLTFPDRRNLVPKRAVAPASRQSLDWWKIMLAGLAGTLLAMIGFWSGRLTRRPRVGTR